MSDRLLNNLDKLLVEFVFQLEQTSYAKEHVNQQINLYTVKITEKKKEIARLEENINNSNDAIAELHKQNERSKESCKIWKPTYVILHKHEEYLKNELEALQEAIENERAEFLKKEFSEENVLFWLACEEFKKTQGKKQMQEKAKDIYMTFLSSKASSQVNVEGQSRLNETILETPHPLMFQKLQDQIFNLMKYDSYSRFLKSDIFLNHKKSEEQEENSPEAQTAAKRASRIYNT